MLFFFFVVEFQLILEPVMMLVLTVIYLETIFVCFIESNFSMLLISITYLAFGSLTFSLKIIQVNWIVRCGSEVIFS